MGSSGEGDGDGDEGEEEEAWRLGACLGGRRNGSGGCGIGGSGGETVGLKA